MHDLDFWYSSEFFFVVVVESIQAFYMKKITEVVTLIQLLTELVQSRTGVLLWWFG